MFGGPGDDVIAGGRGQDLIDGGPGADEFIVEANNLESSHFDGGARTRTRSPSFAMPRRLICASRRRAAMRARSAPILTTSKQVL